VFDGDGNDDVVRAGVVAVAVVVVSSSNRDWNKCESSYRTNRKMGIPIVMNTNDSSSMDTSSRGGGLVDCGMSSGRNDGAGGIVPPPPEDDDDDDDALVLPVVLMLVRRAKFQKDWLMLEVILAAPRYV
jgi:hypothetical protein